VAEELKNANDEKDKLRDILEKEKEKKVDTSKLLDRYDKFKKFGKTLEKVIGDLFAARAEAARREHIHLASRYIIERGNWLSEEPQSFWHALDNIVRATLPDVIGYVFYRLDEYREAFNPVQTCVYDRGLILEDADFRNFCKHVFEELHEKGKKRKDFVFYDLLSQENTPQILHGLFRRTVSDSKKVDGGVVAIAVPLAESDGKIAGGMVCMCTISQQNSIRQRGLFRFYVEALMDIIDMLSMVMARHDVEKAQATAWAMRSHELIAPIHAVKGYQDNLVFLFRNDIANKLENDPDTKNMFAARLVRLGMLCDLLELIASGGSLEGAEYFVPINFEKQILLPIVQPLRDYGKMEKEVDVWYSDKIANLPKLWLSTDGIKRCMFNLIFNAIKYSYRTSRIMVELQETKGNYEIHIVNKGIGVPNGEEERIFRMFTEGSNADQAAAYGAGLGLPVARGMARKHGGDVTLVSGTPERTVFSLVLPKSLEFGPPNKNLSSELML
jgi:signal transduction histidine kinase